MTIIELFDNQTIKAKAKVTQIGDGILNGEFSLEELLAFTKMQKGSGKATCVEALEYVTKKKPGMATDKLLALVTATLKDGEPRIKWESAKVIGNIAKQFPTQLSKPTGNLLGNAEHSGTVVRWATASALSEILRLKTELNKTLLPKIEALIEKETDHAVKKKYLDAISYLRK